VTGKFRLGFRQQTSETEIFQIRPGAKGIINDRSKTYGGEKERGKTENWGEHAWEWNWGEVVSLWPRELERKNRLGYKEM